MGLAKIKPPGWTQEEIDQLQELVGTAGRRTIARKLGRSEYSVKAQLRKLKLPLKFRDGYTGETLASVLGTSPKTVRRWERMRWLKKVEDRFPESAIRRFLVTPLNSISSDVWTRHGSKACYLSDRTLRIRTQQRCDFAPGAKVLRA